MIFRLGKPFACYPVDKSSFKLNVNFCQRMQHSSTLAEEFGTVEKGRDITAQS